MILILPFFLLFIALFPYLPTIAYIARFPRYRGTDKHNFISEGNFVW